MVEAPLEEDLPPLELPDPVLAGRLVARDWALLRDAALCERLPLRELLDLALVPLDLLFVLLDPLRDLELPLEERDDPLDDDFLWVFGVDDERVLAAAITLTSLCRRPPPLSTGTRTEPHETNE